MMSGMGTGMIWGSLLAVVLLLGFAYLIWVQAIKESGGVKGVGQVIAIVIAVLAVIILLYGSVYGGMMGKCGGKGGRMGGMSDRMEKMMDKGMMDKEMMK
jgi:hypothetical protein